MENYLLQRRYLTQELWVPMQKAKMKTITVMIQEKNEESY